MLAAYARNRYEEMQVQASGGKLVVMLYDAGLRFLTLALEAMDRHDLEQQGYYLGKVQQIVCHLMGTLNLDVAQVAHDLRSIYVYWMERLVYANANDDREPLLEVRDRMTGLRNAWEVADRKVTSMAAECGSLGQLQE